MHAITKALSLLQRFFAKTMSLDLIPNVLIGIKIRGVWWQKKQFYFALGGLYIISHHCGSMNTMAVQHEEYWPPQSVAKLFQHIYKKRSVKAMRVNLVTKLSRWAHATHHINSLTLTTGAYGGSLPASSPCLAKRRVRYNSGFIKKKNCNCSAVFKIVCMRS